MANVSHLIQFALASLIFTGSVASAQSYIPTTTSGGVTFHPFVECNQGDFVVYGLVGERSQEGLLVLKATGRAPWNQAIAKAHIEATFTEGRQARPVTVKVTSEIYDLDIEFTGTSTATWKQGEIAEPPPDAFDGEKPSHDAKPDIKTTHLRCTHQPIYPDPTGFSAGNH
jgi:hypothetical protein